MATLDQTAFDAALKTLYPLERIKRICYEDNPFFAMVPKNERFFGKNMQVPLQYGNPQGRSASFANAQSNASPSQYKGFLLTRVSDYGVATIANETIEASRNDDGAFLEALDSEIQNMLFSIKRSAAVSAYRNGSGSIGQVGNGSPTTTITLKETADHTNFEKDMVLVLSTADGGGTVKTGTTKVTDINRGTGVLTVDTDVSTFTAAGAQNDYIFQQGDYDAKISGLDAWVPTSAPGATSFFGVDRTADTERLGGLRLSGGGAPLNELLIEAMARVGAYGGRPTHFFMNFLDWYALANTLDGKGSLVQNIYSKMKAFPTVGFSGIRMQGPTGTVEIYPDVNCPKGRGYLLQMNTWKLHSLGPVPHIFDTDGNRSQRQSSADGVEVRGLYYAQLGCTAPGWNMVVTF